MSNTKHIVIITVPFFGHIIPSVGLARNISQFAKVTYAALRTSLCHIRARGELTIQDEQTFTVTAIDDGMLVGISEADYMKQIVDNFDDIVFPNIKNFVSVLLEEAAEGSGMSGPVHAVIADMLLTTPLSESCMKGIPYFLFHTGNAEILRDIMNVTDNTPVTDISRSPLETYLMVRPESEGPQFPINPHFKKTFLSIKNSLGAEKGILINSCVELEQDSLMILQRDHIKSRERFYCVGPMIPCEKAERKPDELLSEERISSWLDRSPPGSVIYVSFGSLAQPSEDDVTEISDALKRLGKSFILSLAEPLHRFLSADLHAAISSQLEDTNSQGLVLKWAPQKTILAHPSVQLFVSHCGWNSTLESIFFGKPVVGWPFFADQLEDALILERIGMGVSLVTVESSGVARGEKKKVTAEQIIDAVNKIEGSSHLGISSGFAGAAQQWSSKLKAAIAPGGTSEAELWRLLEDCERIAAPTTNPNNTALGRSLEYVRFAALHSFELHTKVDSESALIKI